MKVIVAMGGAKHEVNDASPETSIKELKAVLEPLTGMPAAHMKLLVKGKQPADDATLGGLGASDGAKMILMRSPAGANAGGGSSAAGGASARLPPSVAAAATAPTPAHKPAASAPLGEGSVSLTVAQGKQQHTILCEGTATVKDLKELLRAATGAEPSQQRLLHKGKEATGDATVASLGLAQGGKLMVFFREGHHREVEGAAALESGTTELAALEERWAVLQRKLSKRLLDPAGGIAELGAFEGTLAGLAQDLRNATLSEAEDGRRTQQLEVIRQIEEQVEQTKKELAAAELNLQIGR